MAKGTKMAGRIAGKAKAASAAVTGAATKGERGIFLRLREEHVAVSTMMKLIIATGSGEKRRELFSEMKKELLSHARTEEREFYAVLQNVDATREIVTESFEDHRMIEQLLDRLSTMDAASDEWAELFEELSNDWLDHVEQEEGVLFPAAQTVIDDAQARAIEERYVQSKQQFLRQVA